MLGAALEGGAGRGVFTAGVLDYFLENNIKIPMVSGVSAGAGCSMNYRSCQKGRTLESMIISGKEGCYSVKNLVTSGSFVDFENMLDVQPHETLPFDFNTYFLSDIRSEYVVTCCETGMPEYLYDNGDEERLLNVVKASCSLPVICRPVIIDGKHYLDGSLSDSVPFMHLLENGCEKVLVVFTRPESDIPTNYSLLKSVLAPEYKNKFPLLYDTLMNRSENYCKMLEDLKKAEYEGKVFVLRPTIEPITKFCKNEDKIMEFYRHGKEVAKKQLTNILKWAELPANIKL